MKRTLIPVAALALAASQTVFADAAAPRAQSGEKPQDYTVSVLGDLHYDDEPIGRYHAPGKVKKDEFARNVAMWKKESPSLLAASASLVGPKTAFALQLGDLIQGQAATYSSFTQMLADATAVLEKTYPTVPIVAVCGNHDVLGPKGGYGGFMVPWQARQLAGITTNAVTRTTFGFRHGPDLWIIINFNSGPGTVPIVKQLLADNPDTRYTFVATHGPVLPMDVWKRRWFYLGAEGQDKARREMRGLLAKRNAIVLSGHVHSLEYKDWHGDGGRITEMVLNSVPRFDKGSVRPTVPKVISDTPADYGTWLKTAATNAANARFEALYEEYRPGLKARFAAYAYGHHVLRVSDSGVTLDYYGGDATTPTKTFKLR